MNNKKIIIKFPSRERPKKFRDCLANIIETVSDLHSILILVTVDEDDESMSWVKNIDKPFVKVIFGKSESKIHAVNRDMNLIDFNWDYLVLMSDDMMFIKPHWDKEIISKFFASLSGELPKAINFLDEAITSSNGIFASIANLVNWSNALPPCAVLPVNEVNLAFACSACLPISIKDFKATPVPNPIKALRILNIEPFKLSNALEALSITLSLMFSC